VSIKDSPMPGFLLMCAFPLGMEYDPQSVQFQMLPFKSEISLITPCLLDNLYSSLQVHVVSCER
jgi:hypothetical protein